MKRITVYLLIAVLLAGLALVVAGEDIQRGGTITIAGQPVVRIDDPARFSWIPISNYTRMVAEYLTYTDENNITHPWLLERWEATDDLMTWTLHCRKGVLFNNGDEFNADDIVFNIKRWLDPEVGSSILGLMGVYLKPEGVEKVNEYTVVLNLYSPSISVPQDLYHYPAQIMDHRTFEGDFIKAPVGTGPFTLEEYTPGERVVLKARRDPPYWRNGADGKPLPYVDEIVYVDMGDEAASHIVAFKEGKIDAIEMSRIDHFLGLRNDPDAHVIGVSTGWTRAIRMRVDKEPWDDNRVRTALKLCVDQEKILDMAYYGEGIPGAEWHVAPSHPACCDIEPLPFDPQKAKEMLEEAGYTTPLKVELSVGSGWTDIVSTAEILKQDAAPAFDIQIRTMPTSAYWDVWTECPFGITEWAQRPLGTMILSLAYICDAEGNAVPWNESRWCECGFTTLLRKAQTTLDVEARREIMCDLERIQRDCGSVVLPYWMNLWAIANKEIQNLKAHPSQYDEYLREAWIKD